MSMDQHKFSLAPLQLPLLLLWLRIIIVSTHLLCGTLGQQIDVLIVGIVMVFGGLHRGCPVGLGRRLGLQIEGRNEEMGVISGFKVGKSCQKIIFMRSKLTINCNGRGGGRWLVAGGVSIGLLCVRDHHHHHRLPLLNDQHIIMLQTDCAMKVELIKNSFKLQFTL